MMGGSCSSQRRCRNQVILGSGGNRRGKRSCRDRSISFSSAVGRLCGTSQDSSDEECNFPTKCPTKRAARHSVDLEVPNEAIAHFYPSGDNFEINPTDPKKHSPKSLTDLCINTICRSLPNLDGELPPGLPQDIVDRIMKSLTSHAALNSTTLRALSKCELGSLSLGRCRGVSDEWLIPLSSSSLSSGTSPTRMSPVFANDGDASGVKQRFRSASNASYDYPFNHAVSSPPLRVIHPADFLVNSDHVPSFLDVGSSCPMMMDLDDFDLNSDGHSPNNLQLPLRNQEVEECCAKSVDSRSTSSFVSASSRLTSPLLPSILPPQVLFSSKLPLAQSSPLSMNGPSLADKNNSFTMHPSLPPQPMTSKNPTHLPAVLQNCVEQNNGAEPNVLSTDKKCCNNETVDYSSSTTVNSWTSTLTSLDLCGSQRLTDRGLLQLSHTPLCSLEVALLDNCHGITGKGLFVFSRSTKLHTLSLSNCRRLTDEAAVNVSHLGSLVALNLGGCRCLTDCSLEALGGMTKLRKLDLSQCDLITDDGLDNLNNLSLLEELSLGWCRLISDSGLEVLVEQPNRSQALRTLRLARCDITDVGLEYLKKLKQLEDLDLNGCTVGSLALGETLKELLYLTSLDISYCPGILCASWQGKINALRSLELCYSGVQNSHLSHLRSLPLLEILNLDSCIVADWGIAHLVDNNVCPNLITLDLADTDISDAAMPKIAQFRHLRHLSLFYCNISNRGLSYLVSMKSLEVLNLDSREIGNDGLKYLQDLPLTSLDLFSSRVTDIGCVYLSKIETLTSLELCGGGISDLGCSQIATMSSLTSLNLSQNESITNCGAAALSALTNLEALNLSNTSVNSNALKFFEGLLKLQSLAMYGCNDMDDSLTLSSLQSELPSLRCIRLNSPSNEDGVIDHNVHTENEGDGGEEDYREEEDDEDQLSDVFHSQLDDDSDYSVGSSEDGSMSDFQGAYNEVLSIDTSQSLSGSVDYMIDN